MRLCHFLLISSLLVLAGRLPAQWIPLQPLPGGGAHTFAGSAGFGIFAATPNGMYRSTDNGSSWKSTGLQGSEIFNLLQFHLTQFDLLFASTDTTLFRSIDTGATWSPVRSKYGARIISIMQNGNDVIVASDSIFKSTDLGHSWKALAPLPADPGPYEVVLSLGTIFALPGSGNLWSMSASGGPWSQTKYPSWHRPNSIKVYGREIFVGAAGRLDLTTDNGATWFTPNNQGLDTVQDLMWDFAVNGLTIFATTPRGVFRTTDGAGTWTQVTGQNGYYTTSATNSIEYVDNAFYSGEPAGILASADGSAWHFAGDGILSSGNVADVASTGNFLFASTDGAAFRSTDHGQSWTKPGDLNGTRRFFEFNGTLEGGRAIWKSSQAAWKPLPNANVGPEASIGNTFFGHSGKDVYKSTDSGTTWETVNSIPESDEFYAEGLFTSRDTLFCIISASTNGWRLYSSTDEGNSWSLLSSLSQPGGWMTGYAASSKLICVSLNTGIHTSADGGRHWSVVWPGIANFVTVWGDNIVAGFRDNSLPTNNGLFAITSVVTQILPDTTTSAIQGFTADDSFAYIATASRGVWREPLATFPLGVAPIAHAITSALEIYPNPSRERATISFTLPEHGHITLRLYDECGVMRRMCFDGEMEAGPATLPIASKGLANGVYTVMLSGGAVSANGRLVIAR